MPRRHELTEAQLDVLFVLPATKADLIRHWTMSRDDLAATERRRGAHNQLGYALQLCAFRYPGRLLRPGKAIPDQALRFVADQVRVSPETLTACAARPQTRREQLTGCARRSASACSARATAASCCAGCFQSPSPPPAHRMSRRR